MTVKAKGAKPVKRVTRESLLIDVLRHALQQVEAHHVAQNRLKGRPEANSTTLRIVRAALAAPLPEGEKP